MPLVPDEWDSLEHDCCHSSSHYVHELALPSLVITRLRLQLLGALQVKKIKNGGDNKKQCEDPTLDNIKAEIR